MTVAGKVGKALHKECVGIYNVGIHVSGEIEVLKALMAPANN